MAAIVKIKNIYDFFARLSRYGGITVNLLFAAYSLIYYLFLYGFYGRFIHGRILESSQMAMANAGTDYLLGGLLFFVMALEIVGLRWKLAGLQNKGENSRGAGLFVIWFFHMAVSAVLALSALMLLGLDIDKHPAIVVLVMIAVVIKEIWILTMLSGSVLSGSRPRQMMADLLLLCFYCVAYTATWENIAASGGHRLNLLAASYSIPLMLVYFFCSLLVFVIFYLPLRLAYLALEAGYSKRGKVVLRLSVTAAVISAMLPLFEGHTSVKSAIVDPGKARLLFMNNRGLSGVPPDIVQLHNLQALHLGFNSLEKVPPEIGGLMSLAWLDLSGNRIRRLDPVIGELASLQHLDLHYNGLVELPESLGRLTALRYLNLRYNRLAEIPGSFTGLVSLRELDLSLNLFTEVPEALHLMKSLRRLHLNGNAIPPDDVKGLRKSLPLCDVTAD